jgi:hypothetical protein
VPWIRLDDNWASHPKVMRAGREAAWLWLHSLSYAHRARNDGLIPEDELELIVPWDRKLRVNDCAEKLCQVGLWRRVEGGFEIHDFLVYNPSASEIRQRREHLTATRSEAGRRGAQARWQNGKRDSNLPSTPDGKRDDTLSSRENGPTPTPTPKEELNPPLCPPTGGEPALEASPPKPKRQSKTAADKARDDARVLEVFEHWRTTMGKGPRAVLSDNRAKAVHRALANGYTVEDLKRAVDGCAASDFHQARGKYAGQGKHDDLELICRNPEHIDRFTGLVVALDPKAAEREALKAYEAEIAAKGLRGPVIRPRYLGRWDTEVGDFVPDPEGEAEWNREFGGENAPEESSYAPEEPRACEADARIVESIFQRVGQSYGRIPGGFGSA